MTIDPVHAAQQSEANESAGPSRGISFGELAQLKLIESLISVIQSYLDTVQKSYEQMAAQDKEHERRVKARKARKKDRAGAEMEDYKDTDIGRKSGNSMIHKASDSSTISSGSANNGSSSSSAGLGFSYA